MMSNKWFTIGSLSLIFAETLLIFGMLWLRARWRRGEAALKKSEERCSNAFRRSPLPKVIITARDNRHLDVNDAFLEMSGWSREEVIGRTPFEFALWVHPEEGVDLVNRISAGEVVRNLKVQLRSQNGEILDGLGFAELIEIDGEPCVLAVIAQAETTLRESEERFRLVANTAPVMIWMSGADKRCTYFNDPWLEFTGRSHEAEMGNGWAEGVHAEDLAKCMDTYVQAFDERKPFQMEYRLRRHDGEYRWVFDVGVPRFNPDGAFLGYIGSVVDVTTHKLAEEALSKVSQRLIEAQEEERRWIARELHDDICQRLALISFQLGAMSRNLDPSVLLQRLKEVNEQTVKLGKDVQGLSHRLHSSSLELLGLVSAVSRFCREFSERHVVEVEFHSKNFPERVPSEISLCLFRVLQEGLRNAVKHSGVGHFRVGLCGAFDTLQLTVQDEGIGFDPKLAVHGDGLGLTSMKERLKLVNGVLTISSQPGSGTIIQAAVPLNSRKTAAAL